jgi:hypothetical protein
LGKEMEGTTYGFNLWLKTLRNQVTFQASIHVLHPSGVEEELVSSNITVTRDSVFKKYHVEAKGINALGFTAEDELIFRMTMGSGGVILIYGRSQEKDYDSGIIVPGDITVSTP